MRFSSSEMSPCRIWFSFLCTHTLAAENCHLRVGRAQKAFRSELGQVRTSLPFLSGIRACEKGSVVLSWVLQAKELYPCVSAQGFFQSHCKAVEISCSLSCVGTEGLPQHQSFPSGCLFESFQVLPFCCDHIPVNLCKHSPTVIPRVLSPSHTGH